MSKIEEFYEKRYKILLVIPIIMFILGILFMINFYSENGDIMYKDVSLKGGISATVYLDKEVNINEIAESLKNELSINEVLVRSIEGIENEQSGFVVEVGSDKVDDVILQNKLEKILNIKLNDENYFVQVTGSSLGGGFYSQMIKAMIFAFIFMAVVVFITFRSFLPSLYVVLSAFFDIFMTLVVLNILGIEVSTAGITGLLLLIGYSVDTDILLTTRVLKRQEGTIWNRMTSSLKTGLTMTTTAVVAVTVGYFLAKSGVLKEVFLVIIIGLLIDLIATYLMNASLLKWYVNKKEIKNG
ncbi:hypothetical protein HYV88_00600 [Candidatus Woesearchaeota archaeon]|nr:hypothetical protein [Candidatus Woesearchaeota archaeon]